MSYVVWSLQARNTTYSEEKVQIIGISLDTDTKKLKTFLNKQDMEWPQIQQTEKWNDHISELYNVYVIPRSFIVGRDGKIVAKNKRSDELEKEIAKLIQQ